MPWRNSFGFRAGRRRRNEKHCGPPKAGKPGVLEGEAEQGRTKDRCAKIDKGRLGKNNGRRRRRGKDFSYTGNGFPELRFRGRSENTAHLRK